MAWKRSSVRSRPGPPSFGCGSKPVSGSNANSGGFQGLKSFVHHRRTQHFACSLRRQNDGSSSVGRANILHIHFDMIPRVAGKWDEAGYPFLRDFAEETGIPEENLVAAFEIERAFHRDILKSRDPAQRRKMYADVYSRVHPLLRSSHSQSSVSESYVDWHVSFGANSWVNQSLKLGAAQENCFSRSKDCSARRALRDGCIHSESRHEWIGQVHKS